MDKILCSYVVFMSVLPTLFLFVWELLNHIFYFAFESCLLSVYYVVFFCAQDFTNLIMNEPFNFLLWNVSTSIIALMHLKNL